MKTTLYVQETGCVAVFPVAGRVGDIVSLVLLVVGRVGKGGLAPYYMKSLNAFCRSGATGKSAWISLSSSSSRCFVYSET